MKPYLLIALFVVTWKSHWVENVGCHQPETKDPYTGVTMFPTAVLAVGCTQSKQSENSKEFSTEKEIIEFRKGCSDYDKQTVWRGRSCSDWKVFKEIDFDWGKP